MPEKAYPRLDVSIPPEVIAEVDRIGSITTGISGTISATIVDKERYVTSGLVEVSRLNPILKGSIFNTLIGANTNFFASNLTPTYSPTIFRIHITDNTAGLLNVKRTRAATTVTETLNGGSNLASGCAYLFDIAVESGDSINLQYSATGTVLVCKVMEVGASA